MQLIFIVGTGRCGSTLMHEVLTKHADTSFLSRIEETRPRFATLQKYAGNIYRNEHRWPFNRFSHHFIPTEAYTLIDRAITPIYSRPYRDLTADDVSPWLESRFTNLFESRYVACGAPVMVHKYTGWSRLGFFAKIFPEAKFLNVVRDGRAVANSWLQMRWWDGVEGVSKWLWGPISEDRQQRWQDSGESFPVLAALGWEQLMESYSIGQQSVPADRYMEVKYEDFVANPELKCRDILQFCGLPWTEDFADQFRRIKVSAARRNAFEKDLSSAQLKAINVAIGPALQAAGYV